LCTTFTGGWCEKKLICGDEDYQELQEARGVELVFAVRGMELRLRLGRPWGESSGYDFTVDQGWRIVRVRVKSTMFREGTGYSCTLKDSRGPYKKNSFDFVAAYVIPEDVWYILPEKVVRGMWSVSLNPKLETANYNAYKEAWHLLNERKPGASIGLRVALRNAFCNEMKRGAPRRLKPRS
jgi:PD-(D/E)XK endonuclease